MRRLFLLCLAAGRADAQDMDMDAMGMGGMGSSMIGTAMGMAIGSQMGSHHHHHGGCDSGGGETVVHETSGGF